MSAGANMHREKFTEMSHEADSSKLKASAHFPMIWLPEGYEIDNVAETLTYPTSVTWDDQGRLYVAEAGGTFLDEEDAPARILRVEANGQRTEVVSLDGKLNDIHVILMAECMFVWVMLIQG